MDRLEYDVSDVEVIDQMVEHRLELCGDNAGDILRGLLLDYHRTDEDDTLKWLRFLGGVAETTAADVVESIRRNNGHLHTTVLGQKIADAVITAFMFGSIGVAHQYDMTGDEE